MGRDPPPHAPPHTKTVRTSRREKGQVLNLSIGMSLDGSIEGRLESDENPDCRLETGESSTEGRRLAAADMLAYFLAFCSFKMWGRRGRTIKNAGVMSFNTQRKLR